MDTPDSTMVYNTISENTRRKKLGQREKKQGGDETGQG
jgi:hypothetical protein